MSFCALAENHFTAVKSTGLSLERVPRVPGTRKILSSYVMAPVNFYEIPGEQLPGTRKISTLLISGTRGLIFLTRALKGQYMATIMMIIIAPEKKMHAFM